MLTVKTQVQHTAHNTVKKFRRPGRKGCLRYLRGLKTEIRKGLKKSYKKGLVTKKQRNTREGKGFRKETKHEEA